MLATNTHLHIEMLVVMLYILAASSISVSAALCTSPPRHSLNKYLSFSCGNTFEIVLENCARYANTASLHLLTFVQITVHMYMYACVCKIFHCGANKKRGTLQHLAVAF